MPDQWKSWDILRATAETECQELRLTETYHKTSRKLRRTGNSIRISDNTKTFDNQLSKSHWIKAS